MMGNIKSKLLALLLATCLLTTASVLIAQPTTESVTAILDRSININWNNEAFVPQEADGSRVYPLLYNGRTFLPARALLEKAGYTVGYDAATKSILLNGPTATFPADSGTRQIATPVDKNTFIFDAATVHLAPGMMTQTTMALSPGAVISLDGAEIRPDLNGLGRLAGFNATAVEVITDDRGQVKSLDAVSTPVSGDAAKLKIEIEITGPPWRVVITIKL